MATAFWGGLGLVRRLRSVVLFHRALVAGEGEVADFVAEAVGTDFGDVAVDFALVDVEGVVDRRRVVEAQQVLVVLALHLREFVPQVDDDLVELAAERPAQICAPVVRLDRVHLSRRVTDGLHDEDQLAALVGQLALELDDLRLFPLVLVRRAFALDPLAAELDGEPEAGDREDDGEEGHAVSVSPTTPKGLRRTCPVHAADEVTGGENRRPIPPQTMQGSPSSAWRTRE